MDLNKILIACDARAFSLALGEFMESKARKSIDFASKLIEAENMLFEIASIFVFRNPSATLQDWEIYVDNNYAEIMAKVNVYFSNDDLQKYYFTTLNTTKKLEWFMIQTMKEVYHEANSNTDSADTFKTLAERVMNSAYSCLAEGSAYRALSMSEKVDVQSAVNTFDTLCNNALNSENNIVLNLKSYIINKLQNSNSVVDYVMLTQQAEDIPESGAIEESAAYQYTGTHPLLSFSIDCSSILNAVQTSWKWVFSLYSNMFKTFVAVGKKVVSQVYNFIQSLTVDPSCVSFNSSGSSYTMDNFYTEKELVVSDEHGNIMGLNSLVTELEKGPISINLITSENILFLDVNDAGRKVIKRRTKQKLVGDLTKVFDVVLGSNDIPYDDAKIVQLVEKAASCIDPASVSSSAGRLMLQSFYQSSYLEYFIHKYLCICYGVNPTTLAVNTISWANFKNYYLGLDNLGSNQKYYTFASTGNLYNTITKDYDPVNIPEISWQALMLPLIDTILAQQSVSGGTLEGAFFPYSHSITSFRSSKILVLTDEQIASSWTNKIAAAVVIIVATAVLVKTVTVARKKMMNASLEKEAYWYKMQSEIQNTGSYSQESLLRYKAAKRKTTTWTLIGGGLAGAANASLDSAPQDTSDLKTIIKLINPAALSSNPN